MCKKYKNRTAAETTQCLHCKNGDEIRNGLCSYCRFALDGENKSVYGKLANGEITQCYLCAKFVHTATGLFLLRNENTTGIDVPGDSVCRKCERDFTATMPGLLKNMRANSY